MFKTKNDNLLLYFSLFLAYSISYCICFISPSIDSSFELDPTAVS